MAPLKQIAGAGFVAIACGSGLLLVDDAQARGIVVVAGQTPGPMPFIKYVNASLSGAPLASVAFAIQPKPGSLTDPVVARYQAAYLVAHGYLTSTSVTIPVFGLYPGSNNTIGLFFLFTDGTQAEAEVSVNTASYIDPCGQLNAPLLQQNRQSNSDLSFSYFLLKDYCSPNSPAIFDTDGNLRWLPLQKAPRNQQLSITTASTRPTAGPA